MSRHPLPCAAIAMVVLIVLAIPVLGLYLGQQDNGALSKSTEARKAYDGMTAAFGAGANGPLLVSIDLAAKPAKADQANIDKVNKTEKDDKDKAAWLDRLMPNFSIEGNEWFLERDAAAAREAEKAAASAPPAVPAL